MNIPSMSIQKTPIIAVVGQTASGKTDLAIALAKKFNGEIISADSRQVYRGMNLGTGKVTKSEQRGISHYCLDCASPKTNYTVTNFVHDAQQAVKKIVDKKKIPIVCGGTGFWVDSFINDSSIPDVAPNKKLRKVLSKESVVQLFALLKKLDPHRAAHIDAKNPQRLIRAIEIAKALGKVPQITKHSPYASVWIGLRFPKKELRRRISKRLLTRINQGMISEVAQLHTQGVSWKRLYDLGLEYRYVSLYVRKKISKKEMVKKLEKEIIHFAKRQMTWFKRNKSIHWIRKPSQAFPLVKSFLRKSN